jgi:hypothetical protein
MAQAVQTPILKKERKKRKRKAQDLEESGTWRYRKGGKWKNTAALFISSFEKDFLLNGKEFLVVSFFGVHGILFLERFWPMIAQCLATSA